MKNIFKLLALAAVSAALFSCNGTQKASEIPEEYRGTWSGVIDGLGLSIVMHLEDSCTLDSPDQGAFGLKANASMKGDNTLKVKFLDMPGNFKGSLQGDSLIGTFSQMGMKKQLVMIRGEIKRNRPQTPVPPFPYDTEDLSFEHDGIVLGGTFSTPPACKPESTAAVVLVSGSGKQNRDEEIMEHRPFAVIADALARNGIASLRYDDRGCGESGGVFADATTFGFADDARAAVRCLRERGFGKVGVIGHSEGGSIAFILGADEEGTPDFIISLAGMADRGDSTLFRQMARQFELQGAPKKLAGFAAKMSVKQMLKQQKGPWIDCFMKLDPAPYVAGIKCPCFALNGDKDSQVIPAYNLSKVEALCPAADCRLYPGLNHLFQHCETGLPAEYARIEETFAPEVLVDIVQWVNQQ